MPEVYRLFFPLGLRLGVAGGEVGDVKVRMRLWPSSSLHVTETAAGAKEVRGDAVTEGVRLDSFIDCGPACDSLDDERDAVAAESPPTLPTQRADKEKRLHTRIAK
jgi:hypothetical protein